MHTARVSWLVTIILIGAACSESPSEPSALAPVTSVVIHYPVRGTRTAAANSIDEFEAYAIESRGAYRRVTEQSAWASSDARVVAQLTPSDRPWVFSLYRAGSATITVMYQGMLAMLPLEIRENESTFSPHLEIVPAHPTVFLWMRGGSQDVTRAVTWTSSNEQIATVDQSGRVTGRMPGNVKINATLDGLSDWYWRSIPPASR